MRSLFQTTVQLFSFLMMFVVMFFITAIAEFAHAAGATDPSLWSGIADQIPLSGLVVTVAGFLLDGIMRYTKTDKPISILHTVSIVLNGLSLLVLKVAGFLDAVVGQKASQPVQPPTLR